MQGSKSNCSGDVLQKVVSEVSCYHDLEDCLYEGNCWDNACQESFFGKLKSEWTRDRIYATREEAKQDIFKYIEIFYNRQRRHAALGYVTPVEFEAQGGREKAA
ncbi:MAG: IS3 family transposase [Deltaproteobacteria bacterium]|nr:IS3 family transposase [Deltaproteobacteria bacterium]